jgi:glycosyltransferase involved in cell wall biosynthesis
MNDIAVRGGRMRVLVIHRYYWPDTPPYASMLRKIVGQWVGDGHEVEVLSSQPSYKAGLENPVQQRREIVDNATVMRLALPNEAGRPFVRIANALRLCLAIVWQAVVVRRYDVIMVSTAPPVVAGAAAALASRLSGARFIYHCMDIHPEIGRISGEFRHPALFRILRAVDSWSCRQADPVVVLSADMAQALRERPGGTALRIKELNNFSLPSDPGDAPESPIAPAANRFTILFAGNVGRFQGLEYLVEAMALLKARDDIELVLMGEGASRDALEAMARQHGARVRFVGHRPVAEAKAAMRCASVGFVSVVPGLYRYAYPSKTMTYMEQGCPVLVAVESQSQLADDVRRGGLGHVVDNGHPQALADAITWLADHPPAVQAMRTAAVETSRKRYSESALLPVWSLLLTTPDPGS